MKILARIEKIAREQYLLEGKTFDSFLSARREMTQLLRARRAERNTGENVETIGLAGQIKCRAFGPQSYRYPDPRPQKL